MGFWTSMRNSIKKKKIGGIANIDDEFVIFIIF